MLRFTVLGFPIVVHWMFWVNTALLGGGLSANRPEDFQRLIIWMLAAFVSIVVHELGHALAMRHYGARAAIMLYAFGGLAIPDRGFTRGRDIIVSLAGPFVQILLGIAAFTLLSISKGDAWVVTSFLGSLSMVSIFWALFNLVPILPLDGGHVLNGILGPNNQRITYTVSFALAALLAASMLFYTGSLWNTVFFGMLAYENFQRLRGNQTSSYFRPN